MARVVWCYTFLCRDYGAEERARIGIKDNLVRFSVGIESYEDIEADVLQALEVLE